MELIKDSLNNLAQESNKQYCPYCGKEYKLFEFTVFQTKKMKRYCPDCNCQELEEQKENQQKREDLKNKHLQKLFDNSMISPIFKDKRFSNLNSNIESAIFTECKKYVLEFVPKKSKGMQMIGSIGTGKTTLLAAICNELIQKDYKCLFTTLSSLLDKFSKYSHDNNGDIAPLLHWLCEFDFVVLDDIGRETYTDKRKETVFRIIDTLLNYKVVTAFTANPEMISKLKKIPELEAALDRLQGICELKFEFKGKSLRRSGGANVTTQQSMAAPA